MDLAHVVASMKGDRAAKVECKTCKKTHAFKAPKGITEPGQVATKKKASKKKSEASHQPIEVEWEKLMAAHHAAKMQPYNTKHSYQLGDKIAHPTFGDGIVARLIYPNKVEVLFRTDLKVLIHAGVHHYMAAASTK